MSPQEVIEQQTQFMAEELTQGNFDNVLEFFLMVPSFYELLPQLLLDERFRVRTGVYMLLQDLAERGARDLEIAADWITPLVDHDDPRIRAEAATALEVVGDEKHLQALRLLLRDPIVQVAQMAQDAIEEIQTRLQSKPC